VILMMEFREGEIYYKCWKCGRVFDRSEIEAFEARELGEGFTFIRCPACGSKIIVKIRREGYKLVKAV